MLQKNTEEAEAERNRKREDHDRQLEKQLREKDLLNAQVEANTLGKVVSKSKI